MQYWRTYNQHNWKLSGHNHTHAHTHPFNGPLSGTTQVSRYQKGKTDLDFTDARDSEWQWHQLSHMQVCISFRTDNYANNPLVSFFTGRMPLLPPNQQCQSTEGIVDTIRPHKYTNMCQHVDNAHCCEIPAPLWRTLRCNIYTITTTNRRSL